MGLFSRRQRDNAVVDPNNPQVIDHANKSHAKREKRPVTLSMSRRPTFGQWLKVTIVDILTMAAMGAIGLGVYMAKPAPSKSFPVYFQDGEVVYPQFAYPLRKNIIPIWAAALIAFFVPFVVFLICQIRIRSFWDVNNATIGLLYALINGAVFQVFLKWLIGGLRPHFLAVCKPSIPQFSQTGLTGSGLGSIMYDRSICTGDENEINDSLESFPSGHTTAAFAGFVFLYLYLNAKLKVFSNYHPAFWKLIALYAPILGAVLIGGSLTIDEYHNWYDVVAGAIIGTVMAFSAYRMVYGSIFDFRFNHIPLNRSTPFFFSTQPAELSDAVWTRQAGWGQHEGNLGGAPGDVSTGFGGQSGHAGLGGGSHNAGVFHDKHDNVGTADMPMNNVGRKPVGSQQLSGDAMV